MPRNDLKAYTSVIARIPQELADQVKQYAGQHRCTVSELIRDGLEMRLEAEVPGRTTGHHGNAREEVLHEVLRVVPEVIHRLSPMFLAQIQDTIRTTVPEVLHGMNNEVFQGHSSMLPQPHTEGMPSVLPLETPSSAPTGKGTTEVLQEVLPSHTSTSQPSAPIIEEGHTEVVHDKADFDPTRFILGRLCPRGHAYGTTGQSLLTRASRHCPQCDTEQARERRARRTAAQRPEG